MADEAPYTVHPPDYLLRTPHGDFRLGRGITLTPSAHEIQRQSGMSLVNYAKHLLRQHQQREAGLTQREGEN
jgi:hypothetical protein